MILSATAVKSPRLFRTCAECEVPIVAHQLKLYGMADVGDKPYNLYYHPECIKMLWIRDEPKIADALKVLDEWKEIE